MLLLNVEATAPALNAEVPYGELGLKGDMPPFRALLPKVCCELKVFGMCVVDCDW